MLFNSFIYLFAFLPIVVLFYYLLYHWRLAKLGHFWLLAASLAFYSYWKVGYLPVILFSMTMNYLVGSRLGIIHRTGQQAGKYFLWLGIALNVGLLGYYKYTDFMIENFNWVFGADISLLHLALPLGISFFTFQQIAYLVDSYRRLTSEYSFFNHCLFVSFFPQLIAGPIVHHKEMMPQFERLRNKVINWDSIYIGMFLLGIGLFKKVAVADTFGDWANEGYSDVAALNFITAWKTSLCYSIQIYFDFSGYTDMARGSARMLNINLPLNFNSLYRATSIQDFWRRWHMTLSRFLRDYIYIPLGGNRVGIPRAYINVFVTFLIGGIWHGAGWTFLI